MWLSAARGTALAVLRLLLRQCLHQHNLLHKCVLSPKSEEVEKLIVRTVSLLRSL